MTGDRHIDALLAEAGEARPPEAGSGNIEQVIETAIVVGARQRRARDRRVRAAQVLIACVVVSVATVAVVRTTSSGGRESILQPSRTILPSGDRFVATAGAEVDVDQISDQSRRLTVESGAALFDVLPLSAGESFIVATHDAEVHVRGTVFAVEIHDGSTSVRVYEGAVEVRQQNRRLRVAAQQMWRSGGTQSMELSRGSLEDAAEEAVARRRLGSTDGALRVSENTESLEPPIDPVEHVRTESSERLPGHADVVDGAPSVAVRAAQPSEAVHAASLHQARALLAQGNAAEALAMASDVADRGQGAPQWQLVEGDALRALRRFGEAADSYERAAASLPGGAAQQAGYLAASVRFRRLGQPAKALRSLESCGAADEASPLRERALSLRILALRSMNRLADARREARSYIDEYPDSASARIREIAEEGQPGGD